MRQDIKYTGYSTIPSDYECADGELAGVGNVVPDADGLKAAEEPVLIADFYNTKYPYAKDIVFIHTTGGSRRYILRNGNGLVWFFDTDPDDLYVAKEDFGTPVKDVKAIGNTLLAITNNGVFYLLWKPKEEAYKELGYHLPELPLSFGLQAKMEVSDAFSVTIPGYKGSFGGGSDSSDGHTLTDDMISTFTDQVLAKVNKFIADNSTNAGKFIFPFFVRYAYRLYDGSLTMHSPPILMVTSTGCTPHFLSASTYSDGKASGVIAAPVCKLDYNIVSLEDVNNLRNWSDIVTSVDIFISAPIYTYDQNGKMESTGFRKDDCYTVCRLTDAITPSSNYKAYSFNELKTASKTMNTNGGGAADRFLPSKSKEAIADSMANIGQFYLLKSVKLNELPLGRTVIDVPKDYLGSLTARETMTDDWLSHDQFLPDVAFVYNGRLSISNIKRKCFGGFTSNTMQCHQTDLYNEKRCVTMRTVVSHQGKDVVVESAPGTNIIKTPWVYLFYPNQEAKEIYQIVDDDEVYFTTLEKHNALNGSFCFFENYDLKSVGVAPELTADDTIDMPSKIYNSEINNPFVFPARQVVTVGTANVIALATAARPLSEGQFGQFPLYTFTSDEGVWSVEVGSTGTYTARQPITRDTCINKQSIAQLDNEVLFATDRGIMMLSGSKSQCLSDMLTGDKMFKASDIPGADKLLKMADAGEGSLSFIPFVEFIKEGGIIYDYLHQRIIVWNPNQPYAYVYSLKAKTWGMIQSSIVSAADSYPNALATVKIHDDRGERNGIVDYSRDPSAASSATSTAGGIRKGIIFTRPLKLQMPNVLKTMNVVIQRGVFRNGHVKQALYGSRDLISWKFIGSSSDHYLRLLQGTPYKFFRLAILLDMEKDETLTGCSVDFQPRMDNRLR